MTEREQFEQWIATRKLCTKYGAPLTKFENGDYKDLRVRGSWIAFKKGWDLAALQLGEYHATRV